MKTDCKAKFSWNDTIETIAHENTGGDGSRLFLANECMRLMNPYVPAEQVEVLAGSARAYSDGDSGYVEYNTPYAHYQYEGILYVSSITGSAWASAGEYKVKTDKELEHQTAFHPLATSHWDKAMMVANRGKIVRAMQNYLKSR